MCPHGDPVQVWVQTEDGDRVDVTQLDIWVDPREVDGQLVGRATFAIPSGLPTGWHTLHAAVGADQGPREPRRRSARSL